VLVSIDSWNANKPTPASANSSIADTTVAVERPGRHALNVRPVLRGHYPPPQMGPGGASPSTLPSAQASAPGSPPGAALRGGESCISLGLNLVF
jgi:hypothetical protein